MTISSSHTYITSLQSFTVILFCEHTQRAIYVWHTQIHLCMAYPERSTYGIPRSIYVWHTQSHLCMAYPEPSTHGIPREPSMYGIPREPSMYGIPRAIYVWHTQSHLCMARVMSLVRLFIADSVNMSFIIALILLIEYYITLRTDSDLVIHKL